MFIYDACTKVHSKDRCIKHIPTTPVVNSLWSDEVSIEDHFFILSYSLRIWITFQSIDNNYLYNYNIFIYVITLIKWKGMVVFVGWLIRMDFSRSVVLSDNDIGCPRTNRHHSILGAEQFCSPSIIRKKQIFKPV